MTGPDKSAEEIRKRFTPMVKAGKMTPEELERQVAAASQPPAVSAAAGGRAGGAAGRTPSPRSTASASPGRRNGLKQRPSIDRTMIRSPFRFIALNEVVVPCEEGLRRPANHAPLAGGWCGRLRVRWVAETPLLIGVEDPVTQVVRPMRLGPPPAAGSKVAVSPYVIPGATLRGCLRAALEIVCGARLGQINAHHRYGVRDFDHPLIRPANEEDSPLRRSEVKAGWLHRVSQDPPVYRITPCAGWKTIAIADLPGRPSGPDDYQWHSDWLGKTLAERYRLHDKASVDSRGVIDFFALPAGSFSDAAASHGAARDAKGQLIGELVASAAGPLRGHLVFSNRSPARPDAQKIKELEARGGPGQPKKREYVFLEALPDKTFTVPDEAWARFWLINTKPARNARKPDGSWAALEPSLSRGGGVGPCQGTGQGAGQGKIPVFYIGDPAQPENFQFGLTRFFKLAHKYSVGELRDRTLAHRRPKMTRDQALVPDVVEALFGHVYEPGDLYTDAVCADREATPPRALARKGRVAFGFARLCNPAAEVTETEDIRTVMAAPRASFAPFYLAGRIKDYSDDASTLAGRKCYLPRYPAAAAGPGAGVGQGVGQGVGTSVARTKITAHLKHQVTRLELATNRAVKDEIASKLKFLVPAGERELRFEGEIVFDNVSAVELGGLLWALTHGGRQPGGRHRHLLGRAKPFGAGQMRVDAMTLDVEANDDARRCDQPAPFLETFETAMAQRWPDWPQVAPVQDFLAAGDPAVGQKLGPDYPDLAQFREIRDICKLSTRHEPPAAGEPVRYLGVR